MSNRLILFLFSNAGADKIRRHVNYLFHQKSFYPLFPPREPTDLRLLHEYATINKTPNILVLPSDMKYYMRVSYPIKLSLTLLIQFYSLKDIDGCLCINPGRLMSSEGDGTIARIIVQRPKEGVTSTSSWMFGQILNI